MNGFYRGLLAAGAIMAVFWGTVAAVLAVLGVIP